MRIRLNEDHKPRPSMTPIIDVVFNLLIFFLLASQFAKAERDMAVQVPEVNYTPVMAQMPRNLVVNVHANGQYVVQNKNFTADQLDSIIREAAATNTDQQVILRCDGDALVKYQTRVMDLCTKHKVKSIAITVAPPREE